MHYIAKDTETGGFYPAIHALLSIGACCSWSPETLRIFITLESQPGKVVDPQAAAVNGYSADEWERRGAVPIQEAMQQYVAWIEARKAERRKAKFICHNLEFDRSHLREAERLTGLEIPHRHDWRCSQILFGSLMDKGAIEAGSSGLERLGELSTFWGVGKRPEMHDSLFDAQACLHGYLWLLEVEKREEETLRKLYTDSLQSRRAIEDQVPIGLFSIGAITIMRERERQISQKGYTPRSDAVYTLGQLTQGAICYAETAHVQIAKGITTLPPCYVHKDWPWDRSTFKPSADPKVNLAKAAAMLAADFDRLAAIENGKESEG